MFKLAQYTKRDNWIFLAVIIPFVVWLNYLLFGKKYFAGPLTFLAASACTFLIMGISWQFQTWVAVTLRSRFRREAELIKRLAIGIFLFILITAVTLTILFWGYDYIHFLGYEIDEAHFNWALASGVVVNIFATIVYESVWSFEKWKTTMRETEQLKKEHMHSQLQGLKSQVSPHFLFNSLNSLSSLISESPAEAEQFLDEMSKVYRYLLRNNEEQVVELEIELQFLRSYYHLLKARYGRGVDLRVKIDQGTEPRYLPPLTLQILLDNILKHNLISKEHPLYIDMYVNKDGWLEVRNNVQHRIADNSGSIESGLLNISNKFRLLCQHALQVSDNHDYHYIRVPLMNADQHILS